MAKALVHIPELLNFIHAGAKEVAAEVADAEKNPTTGGGDEDFDWEGGDEEEGDDAGGADSPENESNELRDARAWDHFMSLAYAMRPFTADDRDYREARAVEAFNAASGVMGSYKQLYPTSQSACPHVALVVVTRQMVLDGDPGRRGTDHSESFGACIKDGIHRRTLRRKLGQSATQHKKRLSDGTYKTWMQKPLAQSRIMQAFRDISVRSRLLRDEESTPWLQRKHFRVQASGFATVGEAARAQDCDPEEQTAEAEKETIFTKVEAKIKARMEEGREYA